MVQFPPPSTDSGAPHAAKAPGLSNLPGTAQGTKKKEETDRNRNRPGHGFETPSAFQGAKSHLVFFPHDHISKGLGDHIISHLTGDVLFLAGSSSLRVFTCDTGVHYLFHP